MRGIFVILGFALLFAGCSPKPLHSEPRDLPTPTLVEAGCGRCMFNRKEDKKCNLAIRFEGKSHFVDGFNIKQFGNPDVSGGMCKKVHHAKVVGRIENDRFAAVAFELLPQPAN